MTVLLRILNHRNRRFVFLFLFSLLIGSLLLSVGANRGSSHSPSSKSRAQETVKVASLPLLKLFGASNLTASTNSAPLAVNDSYNVHNSLQTNGNAVPYGLLHNDYDPDWDYMYCVEKSVYTAHGSAYISFYGNVTYYPTSGFTGTDSTTYTVCDTHSACSNATITFNVVNNPPTVADDSYNVHTSLQTSLYSQPYGVLHNDYDPDGDSFTCGVKNNVATAHGSASITYQGNVTYYPATGFVGTDSLTYTACDGLNACSNGTITFNVNNQPPTVGNDLYVVRKSDIVRGNGNFDTAYNTPPNGARLNDFDPDGDNMACVQRNNVRTANGYASVWSDGRVQYLPDSGFVGADSITYTVCDSLNACSTGTIWFFVPANEDDGSPSCKSSIGKAAAAVGEAANAVGEPVNVTNGNMYVQQTDYRLPGVGGGLEVTRTYNSNSNSAGLFGKGWTADYDENITSYQNALLRLTLPDGQVVFFGRSSNTTGAFTLLTPGFQGQITQDTNGYTVSFKGGTVHQFNAAGKLVSIADHNNNQTTLTYDANGKLSQVTDPFGRTLNVTTDANGRITALADALGTIASYIYSANGELQTVTYPNNSKFDFAYSTFGTRSLLTTVTDALGHVVESHAYDGSGRATTSERNGGVEHYTLNYIGSGETDVTDALGHVTKYFFDASKGRNAVTRIEGSCACSPTNVQTWTYDNQLNVLTKTDAANQTTTFTYDANGNPLTATNALGTVQLTYNGFGEVLTATDTMQGVLTNTYDTHGNLLTTKDPLNNTTTFTYDTRGQVLTAKDARNNTTTFTWDTSGRLIEVKDAANHTTAYTYDGRGRTTTTTNALNEATNYEYDVVGRPAKVIYPDTSYVQFTYDLGGRRTKVKDARGYETTFAYDGADRLTSVTNADNKTTSYSYNLMSRLTSQTDALNRTTNHEYDDFNRPVKTIYPAATTGATRLETRVEYNLVGKVKKQIDTAGRETVYDYDTAQRLIKVTDPALQITQYEYNARSQTTAVVDALSQRYEFAYDALGRETQVTRGSISMSYGYDAVGNRTSRTDYNNATTNYAYNNLNRLTTVTYPDTTTVSYSYDQLSRLASATNANGTVSFSHDNRGRLSSTTDVFNQTVGYGYDANSNRTSLSLGQNVNATYQYDVLNRLTQITDSANANVGYAYDAISKLASRTLPNGVAVTYQYDGLNRLTRLTDATSTTTIADAQYQYNTASQITQIVEPTQTRNFAYDSIDRLTTVQNPTQTVESYTYDAVGNRTASHQSSSYSYQPFNRVVAIGSNTYTYDSNGNLMQKIDTNGTWTYAWDYENRLKQVTRPDSTTVSYKYDALGRRIQRSKSAGGSTNYIYDGVNVIKDINSDGSTVDYLNGLGVDDKLRQTSSAGTLYFTQDHLGSTRALTDTSGNVVESVNYDSFGNGASTLSRYGFTGREWDAEANLYYYRNRWYDPQEGRFISADPIGLGGGINPYAYVANNPHSFTDPSGLTPISDEWKSDFQSQRQPMYPDHYNWLGTFLTEFNYRTCDSLKDLFYLPSRILADPGVQFALISMGMPFGTPWAGFVPAAGYIEAGRAEDLITLHHGSTNNTQKILESGLDVEKEGATYVSTDFVAAQDAIEARVARGDIVKDGGIITSKVPRSAFETLHRSGDIMGRPYQGFYPYKLDSIEYLLKTPAAKALFNSGILR
jgi:RHS repeat-associated protein